ncbi:DUF6093 family protein [Trueperella pyogenes]|uniref:DUF6093 family protein n=1 Tax=Trueperella pyogenes TaxID=1661 RepID=UPI00312BB2C9
MGVEKMVRRGRRRAVRLMRASVIVERLGEEKISDSPPFELVRERTRVYEGRAKIQSYEPYEQERAAGGATIVVQRVRVDFPVGELTLEPGDVITVVDSPDDRLLEGKSYRVPGSAPYKSLATAYRVFVDEVV